MIDEEQEVSEMRVSVIIPVYNSELYLRECLDSVLTQSIENMEILLIDDASKDGSRAICDAYAAQYPCVRTFQLDHRGPGAARNEGLRHAKGEYIVFADADDYFPANESIQKMIDILDTTGADVAVGNYCRLWDGRILEAAKHSVFSGMDRGSGKFRYCGFFSLGTLSYVWGKAYRRSFLQECGFSFGNYEYSEDKFFNIQCYAQGAQYAFVEDVVYTYRKNDTSISHQQRERSMCWLQIAADLLKYLESKSLSEKYGDLVAYTVSFAAFFDGKTQYSRFGKKLKVVRDVLKKYVSDPVAHRCFCQLSRGEFIGSASGIGWKVMMWTFAFLMRIKALHLLSFGIKLLIDLRIDELLSDTGRKKSK